MVVLYPGNSDMFTSGPKGPPEDLSAVTWNMAAINNNPFEYWITNDDPKYGERVCGRVAASAFKTKSRPPNSQRKRCYTFNKK